MNVEKITKLHAELLSGISIEDLSDRSLLKLGGILLKQYRGSKSVIRKLEPHQINQVEHWNLVKTICSNDIDTVLVELESRMNSIGGEEDNFNDGILVSFVDLVGSIRVAIFDEDRLDNQDSVEDTQEITLIVEDED